MAPPRRTGNVKSGTAATAPGTRAAFPASAASRRARSGSGTADSARLSPLPVTRRAYWSAAATTGAFAYRSGGTEARTPVSRRMPQAETISAAIISATKVPANDAGLLRTAARARPLGTKRFTPRPLRSPPCGR